jgi:nitroreductase
MTIDLYEAQSTLRAVRRLRPDPIPDDVLERVLQAGAWAPSGGNAQPFRIVVVRRPDLKAGLQAIYEPEWVKFTAGYDRRMARMDEAGRAAMARTLDAGNYLASHLGAAPAILLFCADPRQMAITDIHLDRVSLIGGGSVYPAVQNVMLACRAEGLGCALTTLHCFKEGEVKALLQIPDEWATAALVPIGYPLGQGHGSITRKPVGELAYADTFGAAWG